MPTKSNHRRQRKEGESKTNDRLLVSYIENVLLSISITFHLIYYDGKYLKLLLFGEMNNF